jgi:hypothetical protein
MRHVGLRGFPASADLFRLFSVDFLFAYYTIPIFVTCRIVFKGDPKQVAADIPPTLRREDGASRPAHNARSADREKTKLEGSFGDDAPHPG